MWKRAVMIRITARLTNVDMRTASRANVTPVLNRCAYTKTLFAVGNAPATVAASKALSVRPNNEPNANVMAGPPKQRKVTARNNGIDSRFSAGT